MGQSLVFGLSGYKLCHLPDILIISCINVHTVYMHIHPPQVGKSHFSSRSRLRCPDAKDAPWRGAVIDATNSKTTWRSSNMHPMWVEETDFTKATRPMMVDGGWFFQDGWLLRMFQVVCIFDKLLRITSSWYARCSLNTAVRIANTHSSLRCSKTLDPGHSKS